VESVRYNTGAGSDSQAGIAQKAAVNATLLIQQDRLVSCERLAHSHLNDLRSQQAVRPKRTAFDRNR
jgi:hypothetical protein